jgi:hypothetical protein
MSQLERTGVGDGLWIFHVEIGVNEIAGAVMRPFHVEIREIEYGSWGSCSLVGWK